MLKAKDGVISKLEKEVALNINYHSFSWELYVWIRSSLHFYLAFSFAYIIYMKNNEYNTNILAHAFLCLYACVRYYIYSIKKNEVSSHAI